MVEISYSTHTKFLSGPDAFQSPQAALDTINRMVRMGGARLDAETPMVDSYIGGGTRISAMIAPAVPAENGVTASIRKQNKSNITREQLINSNVAPSKVLDFLVLCLCNGVSIGIAGSTGSGKTTDAAFLINEYIRKNNSTDNRIYIIEDSRELNLIDYDDEHDRPARVIHTLTKPEPNPITMLDLIKNSLRYDPDIIVPAEVRGAEAYEAASAGQTSHTILTTLHGNGARDAYDRLQSMCNMAHTGLSERTLLDMCINAWPIMVYKEKLEDNSRKYMQVFEATGQENGKVKGNMLFRYEITGEDRDESGKIIKVHGEFKDCGCISQTLYRRLRDKHVREETLLKIFPGVAAYKGWRAD